MRLQKERIVIKMPLKSLFLCCKITNIAQWLGALPPGPGLWHARVASVCLAKGLNYTIFVQKKQLLFHPFLAKSWLRVWQQSLLQIEFSSNYGRAATKVGGQDERRPPNKNFASPNPKATIGKNIGRPKQPIVRLLINDLNWCEILRFAKLL